MKRRFPCLCLLMQRLAQSPTPYKCPWCGRVHPSKEKARD